MSKKIFLLALLSIGVACLSAQSRWTRRAAPVCNFHGGLNSLVWTGQQLVAVGDYGLIATSPDATRWKNHDYDSGTNRFLTSIIWTGRRLVAVGYPETILTSADGGVSWKERTRRMGKKSLNSVTWTGRRVVVAGYYGAILTSADGNAWVQNAQNPARYLDAVKYVHGHLFAFGSDTILTSSDDGLTWEKQNYDIGPSGLKDLVWADSQYIAVGWSGTILTSPDGENWKEQNLRSKSNLESIVWTGNKLVTVGWELNDTSSIITSSDGVNWSVDRKITGHMSSMVWTGKQLVIAGLDSAGCAILTSP